MPEHRGSFVVPKREFLPIGTNPKSFDDRYTGTVPLKNITASVIPLLTGTWMPYEDEVFAGQRDSALSHTGLWRIL